jgi:hypothetical protein
MAVEQARSQLETDYVEAYAQGKLQGRAEICRKFVELDYETLKGDIECL